MAGGELVRGERLGCLRVWRSGGGGSSRRGTWRRRRTRHAHEVEAPRRRRGRRRHCALARQRAATKALHKERDEARKNYGPKYAFSFGDYVVKALLGPVDPTFDRIDGGPRPAGGGTGEGGCCVVA